MVLSRLLFNSCLRSGWKLKYQTFLQPLKSDHALFLTDELLDKALRADRTSPDFWKYPILVTASKAWHKLRGGLLLHDG
jgi:hypothetical protein